MKTSLFKDCLLEQVRLHPSFGPQDAVKISYQASHGAEHLLRDRDGVYRYFMSEFDSVPAADLPIYEQIGADYSRFNLAAWKYQNLPPQWLFEMFYLTAGLGSHIPDISDRSELLCQYLDTVNDLASSGDLPFRQEEWQAFRSQYEANGGGAVHHSEFYREKEHPAYRIIHKQFIRLLPLLIQVRDQLTAVDSEQALVLSTDGPAASGKSTVADHLSAILSSPIIHMDDFFLPPALRYPQRLAEIGGNIHYERFIEEILPHIHSKEAFTYQIFDCGIMELSGNLEISKGPIRIVEGSYSHHPNFHNYADVRIFCSIDSEKQQERILHRNSPEMLKRFLNEWIPLEEQYFQGFQIREKANIILI